MLHVLTYITLVTFIRVIPRPRITVRSQFVRYNPQREFVVPYGVKTHVERLFATALFPQSTTLLSPPSLPLWRGQSIVYLPRVPAQTLTVLVFLGPSTH